MRKVILNTGEFTLIDDEDIIKVCGHDWSKHSGGYAYGYVNNKSVLLHRFLMPLQEVDHINRDKLDNRRCNLRYVTRAENNYNQPLRIDNTSGFKGIRWQETHKAWRARTIVNGKEIHLGYFQKLEDAIIARESAERKIRGVNFI